MPPLFSEKSLLFWLLAGHTLLSISKDYICRNNAHLLSHVAQTTLGKPLFRDRNLYWVCELNPDPKCKSVTEWIFGHLKTKREVGKIDACVSKTPGFHGARTFLVGAHFHGTLFLYMQFYMVHVCTFSKAALFFSSKSCPEGRPDRE